MSWLQLADVAAMTQGELIGEDTVINGVSIDSRKVQKDDLFIAIKGDRFDAHDFVKDLPGKVAGTLVQHKVACDVPQVVVDDTKAALGRLAKSWRQQFTRPVIGLTGSNGKTTVKEMISAIFSQQHNVLATLGNFNNDIGMPLTLLRLRHEHDVAVIEMGANHFAEIAYLTDIAKPDVAIVNNAGPAHLEGFGDIAGVARAKGEIFQGLREGGTAIINADDEYADYWMSLAGQHKVIRFALQNTAEVQGEYLGNGTLEITTPNDQQQVQLQLPGKHNAMNALAATAVAVALGADLLTVKAGLESLAPVAGRLAMKPGLQGSTLIDDTYNANPGSANAAINVLAEAAGQRLFVLGDMGELGEDTSALHADIGLKARKAGIQQMYCLGQNSAKACEQFGQPENAYQDKDALIAQLKDQLKNDMTILVKGSRSAKMEQVVEALTANSQQGRSEPC